MTRNQRTFFLFWICFLLAAGRPAAAQDAPMQPWEMAFVHTDRTFYITGDVLWFKVYVADAATGRLSAMSQQAYVELLAPDSQAVQQLKVKLQNGAGNGSIQLGNYLASGAYILRAYTAWMKNAGPSAFFQCRINLLNPDKKPGGAARYDGPDPYPAAGRSSPSPGTGPLPAVGKGLDISLSTDVSQAALRAPVTVNIAVTRPAGDSSYASLSMSVFRLDDVEQALQPAITGDWLQIPAYPRNTRFLPDYSGELLMVRVTDRASGKPVKGASCFLSLPGKYFQMAASISDSSGICRFPLRDYYGAGQMVLQPEHGQEGRWQFEVLSPFYPGGLESSPSINPVFLPVHRQLLSDRVLHQRALLSQAGNNRQSYYAPATGDTLPFFGRGDNSYLLDDYTRFTTMEEVFREFISEVQVRKQEGHYHFRVSNNPYRYFFDLDPLILLDGVPVRETDRIMAYDPLKVKRISVVARNFYQNGQNYNGIISLQTYQGDLAGFKLDPSDLVVDFKGLSLQRVFNTVEHHDSQTGNRRIPDFRELLYWNPELPIDSTGRATIRFFASDLPGKYAIVIKGMDEDGARGEAVRVVQIYR